MKLSNSYFFTIRENIKDEDSTSGNLLVKSGMIKKVSSGVYMFLPLGLRVVEKIKNIIREEMNLKEGQEVTMPTLIPHDIYEASGRMKVFGDSVFKLDDRYHKNYILGPTHEELFTMAGALKVKSYKDLPFNLYQFQTKFRDEARPRYGLIRVREFIMKDAYSFDTDLEGLDRSYQKMNEAYKNAFDRMSINYKIVTADTGVMGGLLSEEFQAITDIGEDILVLCDKCDYSSNLEVSECITNELAKENKLEKELVETKDAKTIDEVSTFMNLSADKFVKTLIYTIDSKQYACLVKGNRDVNETKVLKLLKALNISLAEPEIVERVTNAKVGFAGPIGLNIPVIIDNEVLQMSNFIIGANKTDYHYKNVNIDDFKYEMASDIRNIRENDICPKCGGKVYFTKGIEIGNIFKLGTKYSEAFNLNYLDKDNKLNPVVMGSYGIGVGRCMAAIVEQHNDELGIIWPTSVAPYQVCIITIDPKDEKQMEISNYIYNKLNELNIEVMLDDRNERPGVKFNDADLIGIPIRITVGKKAIEDIIEVKLRSSENNEEMNVNEIFDWINNKKDA
ncbi:MAG: proline--tRNA ligase [Bacilli bacterium]|nr:proline--tRNA ligase [Bacilli bacterium]